MSTPNFPNGFTSWMETHHEVVSFITCILINYPEEKNVVTETQEQCGTGGIYELAEEWTNEFEKLHQGREWDGEYFDEIEAFCNKKINRYAES